MPIKTREFLNAVAILTDRREMRVTPKESDDGAAFSGAAILVSAVLLGPAGVAVGGIVGELAAALKRKGKFQSVGDIIRNDLTRRQREQLLDHIMVAVANIHITDIAILLPLLTGNRSVQAHVIAGVTRFLSNQMDVRVVGGC